MNQMQVQSYGKTEISHNPNNMKYDKIKQTKCDPKAKSWVISIESSEKVHLRPNKPPSYVPKT